MSMESFPRQQEEEENINPSEVVEPGVAMAEAEKFKWNDIFVPEEEVEAAEEILERLGFSHEPIRAHSEETVELPGHEPQIHKEMLLSIIDKDKKPVDRATLRDIVVAMREDEKHITVNVARKDPNERF
jgi:hypothetical protein